MNHIVDVCLLTNYWRQMASSVWVWWWHTELTENQW